MKLSKEIVFEKILNEVGDVHANAGVITFTVSKRENAYHLHAYTHGNRGNMVKLSTYYSFDNLLVALPVIAPIDKWHVTYTAYDWFDGFWSAYIEYIDAECSEMTEHSRNKYPEFARGYKDGKAWCDAMSLV